MEIAAAFQVRPAEGARPGALVAFPYDRELVRRFRETFRRARWRELEGGWFVPGSRAVARLEVWIATELDTLDRHADAKGRDAFVFDPLESPYLTAGQDLEVRTPYSRVVVDALRAIPFARWDPDARIWRVPYRSVEDLRRRWPVIEEAARRNEPEARRQRRAERAPPDEATLTLMAERRRRRYPVLVDDPPVLGEVVCIFRFGAVLFEAVDVEPIDETLGFERVGVYPHVRGDSGPCTFGHWRLPDLQEMTWTRPVPEPVGGREKARRGWWPPDQDERQDALRKLREGQRSQRTREERKSRAAAAAHET
ncbi:MAG: hypothetical protein ABWY78_07275 [Microvirga sp.]